ncbi:RHS repeat-associated core domain-containing protein [Acidobacteria bacterium ACD]|nr:RHS repeat-associated core domain-containing protein [Acidobacteria bacterium ACD]
MTRAGSLSYFSVDGLGSVVATNDPSGTVTHSVVFDAWGNVKAETGTRTHPFTYTGREVGEAGLHFYRARYYQPSIGRFSQEDPIRFRAGLNFYRYVENNPTSFADAFGLETGATFRSQWCMETGSCGLPPPSRTPDEIYDEALRRARETGLPGGWNGPQDAFRHCLGSCMMTRELGETTATFYGWANEKRGDWQKNQETGEREMDDANNACGRRAGRDARSTEDCAARCMFAVHSRELTTYYRRGSTPGYRDK